MRKEFAGAPHAALHFVEHKQQTMLVAQLAQRAHLLRRHRPNAALTLNRLDQNAGRLRPDRTLDRVEIAERHLTETFYLRPKAFEIFLLPARRDRRQRASVKRALERDQPIALRRAIM